MKLQPRSKSLVKVTSWHWWGARSGSVIFLLLAFSLFFMSSVTPQSMAPVRKVTQNIVSPLLIAVNRPIVWVSDYVSAISGLAQMKSENMTLRAENARLREWYQTAMALQAENQALSNLMNIKLPPRHDYVTSRVIADTGNAFAQSLMIQAGRNDGIETGQAVLGANGMIGRIIEAGATTARVLLLADINSRVPVLIEGPNQRAIMAGNNTQNMTLVHLPQDLELESGARVITSGHGGMFPYGLPVGSVMRGDDGQYYVKPHELADRTAFVRVVRLPAAIGQ